MPISMKPSAIDLVRNTFVSVIFEKERAASLFYECLFGKAPETRALFLDDMAQQASMFVDALTKIVMGLHRLDDILPELQALAARHVGYGLEERHYAIVGSALLHMMRELSGPAFDARTEQAWREAYTLVSAVMIKQAEAIETHAGDDRPPRPAVSGCGYGAAQ